MDAVNELEGAAALSLGWLPRRSGIVVTTIRGGANSKDPNVKTVLAALKEALRDHGTIGSASFIFR